MTKKPTTDDSFDRATVKEAANHLTNGLIDQLHDILKQSPQENLTGARKCGQTALNVIQTAEVLRTVHGYVYAASRRLQQVASLMQSRKGACDKPEYLELCGREGPDCDCELVCKYKPKHLRTEGEKAFADAELQSRQFFQNEPPNG
ncbi:hypothetical protein NKG99_07255 [Mesorhizobium sp. M1409]|uniref:hypothetical protein n=1 Tax=unclassified Mesorhizobium TaxID=325217 RepID=UPI00333D226E